MIGQMKRGSWGLLAAVSMLGASSMAASAADLGGNCCADLEERIAELEATTARKGNRKVSLTVSGFVHEALLIWDDGVERNAYVVTNEVARTRVRFVGDAKINADWSAGYLLELGVRSARENRVNQNTDDTVGGGNVLDVRHSAWWLQNKTLGKVWLGQTSEASDGITEITLANIGTIATALPDQFSGFQLRRRDGGLSNVNYRNLFQGGANQLPGEGDRFNVIKYESPTIYGFTASASWGEDDVWSLALRYAGEYSGFKLAGGFAYEEATDNSGTDERGGATPGGASTREHVRSYGGSASILHVATGLFVTGTGGFRDDALRNQLFQNTSGGNPLAVNSRDYFWDIQGGIEKNWFGLGKSTLWGEYFQFRGGAAVGGAQFTDNGGIQNCSTVAPELGAAAQRCLGSNINVWGVGFNQAIDAAALDLYVLYRHTETNVTVGNTNNVTLGRANLRDFDSVEIGSVIKF